MTRRQLLVDPRVPHTKSNSSAAITLDVDGSLDPQSLLERVKALVVEDYQPGSDPGVCVARAVPAAVREFGRRTQRELVTQEGRPEVGGYPGHPPDGPRW